MKRGTVRHPKLRRLARLLGVSLPEAVGRFAIVLDFTAEYAFDGDVTDSLDVLAEECGDTPERMTEAMVAAKLFDRIGDRVLVHDWPEHCEDSVHTRLAVRGERFADGTEPRDRKLNLSQRQRLAQIKGRESVHGDAIVAATSADNSATAADVAATSAEAPALSPAPAHAPTPSLSPSPSGPACARKPTPGTVANAVAGPEADRFASPLAVAGLAGQTVPPLDETAHKARQIVSAMAIIAKSPIARRNQGRARKAVAAIVMAGRDPIPILDDISNRAIEAKEPGGYLLAALESEAKGQEAA